MPKRALLTLRVGLMTAVFTFTTLHAQTKAKKPNQILMTNVNIFDGKSDKLAMSHDVLVEGNLRRLAGASRPATAPRSSMAGDVR